MRNLRCLRLDLSNASAREPLYRHLRPPNRHYSRPEIRSRCDRSNIDLHVHRFRVQRLRIRDVLDDDTCRHEAAADLGIVDAAVHVHETDGIELLAEAVACHGRSAPKLNRRAAANTGRGSARTKVQIAQRRKESDP